MPYILFAGKTGTGKTSTMTRVGLKRAIKYKNLKIFANYHIKGVSKERNTYLSKPEDVEKVDCDFGMLMLDDFWQWLDSRCSSSQKNIVFSNTMAKARKMGKTQLDVLITSQDFWAVDRRLRLNCDILVKPTVVNKKWCYVVGLDAQDYIQNMVTVVHEYYYPYYKIWNYYDTREKIKSAYETDLEDKFERVSALGISCMAWLGEHNVDKITKSVIRLWSYDKRVFLDDKMIEDIYAYVKFYSKYQTLGDKKKLNSKYDVVKVGEMIG